MASTAWFGKYSIEACDKLLAAPGAYPNALTQEASPGEVVRSLGGIRLGMTHEELLAGKGKPIRQEPTYWVYNSVDSKHDGVLTAAFSSSGPNSVSAVRAVEYTGDEASAPTELPYLNDWSSVKVIEKYGAQIDGRLTLTGEMTFRFRNGVYVNTHDEKVYRYGIVAVP